MPIVRRSHTADAGDAGRSLPADGTGLQAKFPALWEMLSETLFADGSERETSTLLLFVDAGLTKLCINDRAEGVVSFVSGRNFAEAMDSLEQGLVSGTLDWRASGGKKKR